MREVMIGFQLSALIPIFILLRYKPTLNVFFKLLLASILLSICFDIIGDIYAIQNKSNISLFCTYHICNAILVTFMWQKVPFYNAQNISAIQKTGIIMISIMVLSMIYFGFVEDTFYILSSLSVFLGLILALQYYYIKVSLASYSKPLEDSYFIVATGYILFCLSTIIIIACHILYNGYEFLKYTWVLRQMFYLIYNIIIGYAFYVLYRTQNK